MTIPATPVFDFTATDSCPCGRMSKPAMMWLCRICYLEKEIGYALSELERDGEAWLGHSWHAAGLARLRKLAGVKEEAGA